MIAKEFHKTRSEEAASSETPNKYGKESAKSTPNILKSSLLEDKFVFSL